MSTSPKNRSLLSLSTAQRLGLDSAVLFEACERRLVLSAQLMFDVLGDQALELHGDISLVPHTDTMPIESHLKEAHAASGWNFVQQQFGLTGKGQTVAVIDSGIAWDHVALGKGLGPGYRVVGGWDFTEENDANPYDDGPMGFHGTHVAGIIGNDNPMHSGVAPDVDLVALRVFNDMGQGQLSWVERALQWVHDNRNTFENPITTVNLSLGTTWNADVIPNWATLEEELQALSQDGIVVTASAGNSFQQYLAKGVSYPAASPYVLPVASVDDDGRLSDFSQRNAQVIAAPGRNIFSTVPDHVLGRDGKVDDFTTASGTSMAAPYVAGASVLVRQAMEMVGYSGINLTSIASHLHSTADTIFDAVTGTSYNRLNLQQAIDSLIPDDNVGNTDSQATDLNLSTSQLDGWINTLDDRDVYRFTPATAGTLRLDGNSQWLDSLQWSLQSSTGLQISSGGLEPVTVPLVPGQTYHLLVSGQQEIGSFQFDLNFSSDSSGGNNSGGGGQLPPAGSGINLGPVKYLEQSLAAGQAVRVQATQDGIYSVQWTNPDAQSGNLSVIQAGGPAITDTTWSNGALRVDVNVTAGQWLDIQLPGVASDQGNLALANVIAQVGSSLTVQGGLASDNIGLDLTGGVKVRFGEIEYAYPQGAIKNLTIDAHGGNDSLTVLGSSQSDKVDLRPGSSTFENAHVRVTTTAVEQITYNSGGGPDRVYLYDSDGDDTLTARPRSAELSGVGYKFAVQQVDRIYVHATGSGQDYAYLHDSAGDDRLSVRPQFSSMTGNGYFNYVRGFERVYAYATAGGIDQADLYDSSGNDRFATSGETASIVGPGFSSFTRSFEQVNAYAEAGGSDLATLYGSNSRTQWQQGSDFISFREDGLTREARGFTTVEKFVAGQALKLGDESWEPLDTRQSTTQVNAATHSSADSSINTIVGGGAGQLAAAEPATGFNSESGPLLVSAGTQWNLPAVAVTDPQPLRSIDGLDELDVGISGPAADTAFEHEVLREIRHVSDWVSERLELPEEALLLDPESELDVLDEIFSRHL